MPIQLYGCKIAVRSTVKLLTDIKDILSKNEKRERLFRNTVFGPWLDIRFCDNDCHLMHFVLQHQVKVSNISSDSPPLQFIIGDDWLEFGRKEFCLITGFRFGKVCKSQNRTSAFRDRVFPEKKTDGIDSVYATDCLELVKDENRFLAVSDDDAVRLCLLLVAMLVFMGIEERNCIPKHILSLVEDFDAWNVFPWGEYMWHKFYQRTVNVVDRHRKDHLAKLKKNPKFSATYNLYGFAWAFKIWILESYPKSINWWAKDTKVIPRGLAWSKCEKFRKSDHKILFGPESIPIMALYARKHELRQPWCIASIPFIKGLADPDLSSNGEKDDGQQVDSAEDHLQADSAEDHQQADCADDQHQVPRLQILDKNDVENVNRVQSSEAQKEMNVSTTAVFDELFHLQTNLALIAKHIASVPKQDILELFQEVKTRVSEIQTVLNDNSDGGVVSDIYMTPSSPCEADHDVDVDNDVTVRDVDDDHADHDVDDDHGDHDVDGHPMEVDNPVFSKPTSLACEAGNGFTTSDAAHPMEIDKEVGKKGYNESQLGSMDVLLQACQVGVTPDFPALDEHQPATEVGAFHEKNIKQTTSLVHGDDDPLYDDFMNLINDDADATRVLLEEIPFDNENGKGVEVMEQVSGKNVSCVQKEQTTPLQTYVEKDQTTPSQQIVSNQGYANVVGFNLKNCAARLSKPHLFDMSLRRCKHSQSEKKHEKVKPASDPPMPSESVKEWNGKCKRNKKQSLRRCQHSQSEKKHEKIKLSSIDPPMPSESVKEVNGKRKRDKKQAQPVEHGENLVGKRIKVWWPADKKYYEGVVESYDCSKKRHKLSYDDGEVERLNLKSKKWELVENVFPTSDCLEAVPISVASPETVMTCVQGYKVKNINAPILESIFKKHGDIAANCAFLSSPARESVLEVVCEVVRKIKTNDETTIISDMEELQSQVSAAEAIKINVAWLRAHLEAIHKRTEAKKKCSLLMKMNANTSLVTIAAEMDLKEILSELTTVQERFEKAKRCVEVLNIVKKQLNDSFLESKAETDSCVGQPIL